MQKVSYVDNFEQCDCFIYSCVRQSSIFLSFCYN